MILKVTIKKFLPFIYLLITITGFAQENNALDYYNLVSDAFGKNDFKTADSLYVLSAKLLPHKDTYFNLALTKNRIGDFCRFCECIKKASYYGDSEAEQFYHSKCTLVDITFYDGIKEQNAVYFGVLLTQKCYDKKSYEFYKKYNNNNTIEHFLIVLDSTLRFKEEDFSLPNFAIEDIPLNSKIYFTCDEAPQFPGGEKVYLKYLKSNLNYSEEAKMAGISGMYR